MPKRKMHVQASTFGVEVEIPEEENRECGHLGTN
jgi:hypothetical protein